MANIYRGLDTLDEFSAIFIKEITYGFLFAFLHYKPLLKKAYPEMKELEQTPIQNDILCGLLDLLQASGFGARINLLDCGYPTHVDDIVCLAVYSIMVQILL